MKEEEILQYELQREENIITSFKVKFVNIEESKSKEEILTTGTVQT